jgi:LCP family protein required for cell wall assembly
MVLSYDVASKQVAMISIPRDLYVDINDECGANKINFAHACGEMEKYDGGGPALASETISKVLDIPIHYYVRANFTGFKEIVDAVGGIDVNVEEDLYDYLYPTDNGGLTTLYIKKGMQHMDGNTALMFARSRETTSDFDRAKRQQLVLTAIKTKVTSTSTLLNPSKIISLATALGNNIKTDFDMSYVQRAIDLFKGVETTGIKNRVFDNSEQGLLTDSSSDYAGYILIPRAGMYDYSKLAAAAKNIFSDQSIATEGARLAVLNGTKTPGLAGRLAEKLQGLDYNVVTIDSAETQDYIDTKIVDGTNGTKSGTITALEQLLNVKAVKSTTPVGTDIVITVGSNYKE